MNFGAAQGEWERWSLWLGLTADLLPVVSNPNARISSGSTLKTLGKVPSLYSATGVCGIHGWTAKQATEEDVLAWAENPDYGICLQTRVVRAIDVDVEDAGESAAIRAMLAPLGLPTRAREGSNKFLMLFRTPGEMTKRRITTRHGVVELLATGQQCIVSGTHPSGLRYQWPDGIPVHIPEISSSDFANVWG